MQAHLSLAQAFRIRAAPCIAFIGSGGKTTTLFRLARELRGLVIVTATSHLGLWQTKLADKHIRAINPASLKELKAGWQGVVLVTGEVEGERTQPVHGEVLEWLRQACTDRSIPMLIEADGSREKPLKAWAEHEPPIPSFVDLVVQVVGLGGLGKPLAEADVHRAEIFSQLSGLELGQTVSADDLIKVLCHPSGGLKNIPSPARTLVFLNQADSPGLQSLAYELSQPLLRSYDAAIIASLKLDKIFAVNEQIAGVVLAAGEASRYGQPKQLLDWKGEPFVRAVAKTALQAGLSPVVIVTGANAEQVEASVGDLAVSIVRNEEWKTGQAGSIKAGVQVLAAQGWRNVGGAVFLLADQPQLTASVLHALVEKHAQGLYPILVPMVMDRRANPVLFDRLTFPDLVTLEGDTGGRAIFHKHRVEYLPWHDDRLLLDVDTPEMYRRLIADDTL